MLCLDRERENGFCCYFLLQVLHEDLGVQYGDRQAKNYPLIQLGLPRAAQ